MFETQRQFNINFDNTRISAYAYVGNDIIFETDTISYRTNWTRHAIDNTTYWNTIYKPVGKFDTNTVLLNSENTASYLGALDELHMFAKCVINDKYSSEAQVSDFNIGDAISLKCLATKIMPQIDFNNIVEITSNKEVITLSGAYSLLKLSSAFSTEESYSSKIYTGMPLNITYYQNGNDVHLNIEEVKTFDSFGMLFRITEEY